MDEDLVEAVARALDRAMYPPSGGMSSEWAGTFRRQAERFADVAIAAVRKADAAADRVPVDADDLDEVLMGAEERLECYRIGCNYEPTETTRNAIVKLRSVLKELEDAE